MLRLFRHYVPYTVLALAAVEFLLLFAAAELAWLIRFAEIDASPGPFADRLVPLLNFAIALQIAMVAVGAYTVDALRSPSFSASRLIVAICLGVITLSMIYFLMPGRTLWRSNSLYAMGISFVFLMVTRIALTRFFEADRFKRRVLVLGAGQRAARLARVGARPGSGFLVVGHLDMGDVPSVIPTATPRASIDNLREFVRALGANEVVLAIEERRRAIPLADLLRVRTAGVHVNEISTFLERETGRIDLRSTNPSSLIFSDGFSSGRRLSSIAKRLFDLSASALLLLLSFPVIALCAVLVKLESAGPAFYRQTRVGLNGEHFLVPKLRSMRQDAEAAGRPIWAEKDDPRITRVGRFIRKVRIDELPQVWTVLKGQMSFVGPRPERPAFVAELEEKIPFYAERHMVKPGITGWAQINYPYGASLDDARHKLEYDLYYAKNYTPFLDIVIILQTIRVVLFSEGAR